MITSKDLEEKSINHGAPIELILRGNKGDKEVYYFRGELDDTIYVSTRYGSHNKERTMPIDMGVIEKITLLKRG